MGIDPVQYEATTDADWPWTTQNATDLLKLEYGYGTTDNNGNVQSQTITVPTVGGSSGFVAVQSYTYDALNRLKSATETVSSSQTWKQTFLYDRYGNRNFDTANTTTLGSCSTAVCNPTVSTSNNRFSSGQGYSYDNAGNTTVDANSRQFTYDAENKQTLVKDASNVTIGTYFYDGDGGRVKKTSSSDSIIFVYDTAGRLIEEYPTSSPTSVSTAYVYAGSRLLTTETSSGTKYLTNDNLGSPRINTNGSGGVISRHDYLPFGEDAISSQRAAHTEYFGDDVRKKFTGYERDDETELDFAQARYYAKTVGRFSSVDPTMASADIINPQTFNRYDYVGNNPVNVTDPTGEVWGVLNGSIIWYKDDAARKAAKAAPYNGLVAVIAGTNQLVVLSATANAYTEVGSAEEALKVIVAGGATAEAVLASAEALGVAVAITATGYVFYKALEYNASHPEQQRANSCPAIADCTTNYERQMFGEHFPWGEWKMSVNKPSSAEGGGGESSPADPNSAKPSPEDNEPTDHAKQRRQEARSGDPNRDVGDPNRVRSEGRAYRDNETGYTVYVKGNRVAVYDGDRQVTQFKNSRANTQNRVRSGKWTPLE